MYLVFKDASIAQNLREAGFCVIQTNHGAEPNFLVLNDGRLLEYLSANFAEQHFVQTDVVCF